MNRTGQYLLMIHAQILRFVLLASWGERLSGVVYRPN